MGDGLPTGETGGMGEKEPGTWDLGAMEQGGGGPVRYLGARAGRKWKTGTSSSQQGSFGRKHRAMCTTGPGASGFRWPYATYSTLLAVDALNALEGDAAALDGTRCLHLLGLGLRPVLHFCG